MIDRHVDDILADFHDLPLPEQMRAAAKVLEDAAVRHPVIKPADWTPGALCSQADIWEAEDRAKAEQGAMVEELARILFDTSTAHALWTSDGDRYRLQARQLISAGYRKGGSDE